MNGIVDTAPLDLLRKKYPWPEVRPNYRPFRWALDGGGRHLVNDVIGKRGLKIMLEIGVFVGGSCLQWLEANPTLTVIGVDPWPDNAEIGDYFARTISIYRHIVDLGGMSDEEVVAQMNRPDAALGGTLSNLWEYRDRFIPVRGYAPEVLQEIDACGVIPDIVFLDAMKTGEEITVIHALWPNCIITGDDWSWADDGGVAPIREPVIRHADSNGLRLTAECATWLITPRNDPF